ncbi:carbohydrate sulfotransferase 11-like, partial [Patella vulgata]|uniref:carbohydrate sulfotransferase 11-like n=1 Tax=Patella vulgata TaxID=6465 RepID=UPI0024A8A4F0
VIARDPFSRLFSGFANKLFEVNPSFWSTVGRIVIRNTRTNASKKSLSFGHDVSFPELVKYVIMSERSGSYRDGHFIPISDHCRPCQIKYDIVAKMETIKEDTMFVLKRLNMTHVDELHSC